MTRRSQSTLTAGTPAASPAGGNITQLLAGMRGGDAAAAAKLLDLVHRELRRIAAGCLRGERAGHTLQATDLAHEAYLRLAAKNDIDWRDRVHFFAVAAQIMRRVLVDYARARHAVKRGGHTVRVNLPDGLISTGGEKLMQVIEVDEALTRLAEFDPRQARIVELRFFGGLTEEEIAEVLNVSPRTVKRDWGMARAWLWGELSRSAAGSGE